MIEPGRHLQSENLINTREICHRCAYQKGLNRFGRPATYRVPHETYLEANSKGTISTSTKQH